MLKRLCNGNCKCNFSWAFVIKSEKGKTYPYVQRQKRVILLKLEACSFIRNDRLERWKSAILLKIRYFAGIFQGYYLHSDQFSTGFLPF